MSQYRRGKTSGMAITGIGLSVRPEALAAATQWARRRLVASLVGFARIAEEAGLDAFFLEDVAFDGRSLGAFAMLGHLAGATDHIGLGVVCPAHSIRAPSIVAKLVAGLDVVSGGRALAALLPGVRPDETAAGWSPIDLEAAEVVRRSLAETAPSHEGPYFKLDGAWNEPRFGSRTTPLYRVVRGSDGGGDALVALEAPGVVPPRSSSVPVVAVGPLDTAEDVALAVRRAGEASGSSAVVIEWPEPFEESRVSEVLAAAVQGPR